MPYLLRFHSGRYAEHTLALPESVTLGRAPAFGVALDDDAAASSEHCRIVVREDGRIEIEDLGSTNGTEVNGQPVRAAALRAGDEILIGATRLTLEAVEPPPPPPAAPVSAEPASAALAETEPEKSGGHGEGDCREGADEFPPISRSSRTRRLGTDEPDDGKRQGTGDAHGKRQGTGEPGDGKRLGTDDAHDGERLGLGEPGNAERLGAGASGDSEAPGTDDGGDPVVEAHPARSHPKTRIASGKAAEREPVGPEDPGDLASPVNKMSEPDASLSAAPPPAETASPPPPCEASSARLREEEAGNRKFGWRRVAAVPVALGLAALLARGCGPERNMVSARAVRAAARQMGREGVTLTVSAPEGEARTAEPLSVGVPLPKGRVSGPERLALLGPDGVPVPCQIAAQTRWPDGSVKWVLLDFQANVATNGPSAYRLAMREDGPMPEQAARATLDGTGATLETAGLKLTVRRNEPGLIHAATANGRETIRPDAPAQAVLTDADGREYRASKPDALELEAAGPMRATLLVRGHFVAENGAKIFDGKVGYDLRIHVYAGKPYARLAFTLRNDGWYGYRNESRRGQRRPRQWLYMKGLDLDVPFADGPAADEAWQADLCGKTIPLAGGQAATGTLWYKYPSHTARDRNDETQFEKEELGRAALAGMKWQDADFYWLLENGPEPVAERGAMPGRIGLADAAGRPYASLAVRRFRQNFPGGFVARAGPDGRAGLSFRMFPPGGYWPRTLAAFENRTVQFEGGRRKTADALLSFGPTAGAGEDALRMLDEPLYARAPTAWYRDTAAVLPLANAGLRADEPEMDEALARFDRLQRAKVVLEAGDPAGPGKLGRDNWGKVSIPNLWERAPEEFMGWMNYGDLIWTFGYCSLYYGWPYSMLIHWLRLGDREFMDVAEDMARHRYDIDQYHVEDTATHLGGFQRLERGEHGHLSRQEKFRGRNTSWEGNARASHTWNRCLLLHWALTGDPRSLEAARQNGRAFHRFFYVQHRLGERDELHWQEYRTPAWAMDNWLALYEYTGEPEWLERADEIFTKTLLAMEAANGRQGHILEDGRQPVQFLSYIVEPVCRLHHWTGRKDAVLFLDRVLRWQRAEGSTRGFEKDGLYWQTLWVEGSWNHRPDITQPAGPATPHYNLLLADGYAYLAHVLGAREHGRFARKIYWEYMLHFGLPRTGISREDRMPLGYHDRGYVFMATPKIHAFSGRYGQLFMAVEEGL